MKRTFQRPLALILTLVMLLGLLPGTALAEDVSRILDGATWTDAGWNTGNGGPTATVISNEGSGIQVSINDTVAENTWRAATIQATPNGITGVGQMTMDVSGTDNISSLHFQASLGGSVDNSWKSYGAIGSVSNGSVTFQFKEVDENGTPTETDADLTEFSPAQVTISVGGNSTLPVLITFSNITLTAPEDKTQCTVTLSATEDGNPKADSADNFTKAAFQIDGQALTNTTVTFDSGTKITVLGAVWLSGTAGDYLDSVTVNSQVQSITKGEDFEFTVTDANTSIVADYKYLADKPGGTDPAPDGDKVTVSLSATEGGAEKTGNFIQAVFSVDGISAVGEEIQVDKNTVITVNGNVWTNDWLEALTVNGSTPANFTPYESCTVTVTGDTTIAADYRYAISKPEYTPKPSLPANADLIEHIVPWSADGWLTASGQTSAGYVYLKHVGGVFDTTQVKEDGTFGLLYQTDTANPGSKLFLSFSSNSDDNLPWAKVTPTSTTAVSGYPGWYRSEFSVAAVKKAFGSSFGYMDQIGVWLLDGLHLNAKEAKLYYVDGSGAYVETQRKDAVTGYPWKNQSNRDGGIALIGDSIVHNPRVNSEVGLKPDKGDWNAILGRENCDNYGIGGEKAQHIANRIREVTENGDYQYLVTLFGINNLGDGDEATVTNTVISNYTTVLNAAKTAVNDSSKNLEKVFVISLLPSTPLTYEGVQMCIQHVNAKLKELCERAEYRDFVTFVNVYPELLYEGGTPLNGCTANGSDNDGNHFSGYEPHGDPQYFFTSDGLHPNAAGYAEIAKVLNPLLGGDYASSEGVTGDANSFGTSGWTYGGDGWSNSGTSTGSLSVTSDGKLNVSVRFNSTNWSQAAITNWSDGGHTVSNGVDMISMDVYLEKSAVDASRGTMLAQVYEFGSAVPLNTSGETVTVNGIQYYKTALNIKGTFKEPFQNFAILFIARNSAFNGNILVDNIAFQKSQNEQVIKVVGNGNFSKDADGMNKTINLENGEIAQTPTYSNSGHSGRLNKGAKVTLKIKLNDVGSDLSGKLKVTVIITGTNGNKVEVSNIVDAAEFQAVTRIIRAAQPSAAAVEIDIPEDVISRVENVKTVAVKAQSEENNRFNYNGTLDLTELTITNGPAAITSPYVDSSGGGGGGGGGGAAQGAVKLPHTWDFAKGADSWEYNKAWDHDYSGGANTKVKAEDGKLRVDVDFSKDGSKSWSQLAVTLWHNSGMKLKGATHASLDFYYRPDLLDGGFSMKLFSNAGIDVLTALDASEAEQVQINGITYNKVTLDFIFPALQSDKVQDLALCLAGQNTTYKGALYIDNLSVDNAGAVTYVNSTLKAKKDNSVVSISGNTLTTASGQKVTIPSQVTMVDGNADASARALYAYLKAMGDSDDVLFGQQYSFNQKAGSSSLSDSDTYDVVGDYAAIYGLDGLALAGNEFSASRCNELYGTNYPSTAAGHVAAAAYLSNKAIERGEIVTLSLHMPNFSVVSVKQSSEKESYAHYDFSGYTPNTLTGDPVSELLPGGKYNEVFNAYLDMVADYGKQVNGAVLFRPFHENTGSWFWWGKAFCDPATYQNIFRYTVEYLRDIKGVHNFLYVYGPGSEAESVEDYAERYPGDSWVDMVGFDMYNTAPDVNSGWLKEFEKELAIVDQFAKDHNKLIAVTETGAANAVAKGDSQTALLKSGNKDKDWYNRVLNVVSKSNASYMLVWANFGQTSGFYTPYVLDINEDGSLYGHEMLDHFISYYNDSRSVFAADQKAALSKISGVSARAVNDQAEGYFTAPISGRRVLEATELVVRMTDAKGADVKFVLHGSGKTVTLSAESSDGVYFRAQLSKADLESLGSYADGSAELLVNGVNQQTIKLIYNIAEPVLDRKIVDNFDTYYGVDGLLNKAWTVNAANGCSITAALDQGVKFNGDSSLKLEYTLSKDGYAGASFSRETDWSGCNALQLWTVPDGKNQKTVVQITANGQVYEAYLNHYPDYVNAKEPVLVTIPFAEFVQRDADGQPKGGLVDDCKSISGAGLWVNAVTNVAMVNGTVSGVLRYDNITAVENGPNQVTVTKASGLFADVPVGAWFYDAVCFVSENGLMNGYGNGLFGPDDQLSRAQLAQILYSKENRPSVTGSGAFSDVPADAWYANAVSWAAANGIVSGYGDGRFGPDDNITREQLAVMLWHYTGSPKATAEQLNFSDASSISDYALDAMRWAVENGILSGYGDGNLGPQGQATRAQAAQMLKNFLKEKV